MHSHFHLKSKIVIFVKKKISEKNKFNLSLEIKSLKILLLLTMTKSITVSVKFIAIALFYMQNFGSLHKWKPLIWTLRHDDVAWCTLTAVKFFASDSWEILTKITPNFPIVMLDNFRTYLPESTEKYDKIKERKEKERRSIRIPQISKKRTAPYQDPAAPVVGKDTSL